METVISKILLKLRHNLDVTSSEKKVPLNDIEYKLLKSTNDLIKGDDANQDSGQARFDMNDEDDLFWPGLGKRMKKINPWSRGNLRVQI